MAQSSGYNIHSDNPTLSIEMMAQKRIYNHVKYINKMLLSDNANINI